MEAAQSLRPLMFSLAYRLLGSVSDAEDVVQDAYVRLQRAPQDVHNLEAYVTTVTTRLAIDELRSARRRREDYVGPWLPEPVLDIERLVRPRLDADPQHVAIQRESVSTAFLVLLERLSPLERAVFVLHDVLDYGYADVARVLERTEAACRQLATRARARVAQDRPRYDADVASSSRLAAAFLEACQGADLAALERLLAAGVTFSGDGGGKAQALAVPLVGRQPVARFVMGLMRQISRQQVRLDPVLVNGQPGLTALGPDGSVLGVLSLQIADGEVVALGNVLNPDKLRHLGHTPAAHVADGAGRWQGPEGPAGVVPR